MTPTELAPRFFIAVAVILVFCQASPGCCGRAGQPPVVSEMLAGVLLGPSLLGPAPAGVQHALFPAPLRPVLYVVGQLGLVLFMFQSGYEFPAHRISRLAGTAGAVSLAGVTAPLLLGVLLVLSPPAMVPVQQPGVPLGVTAAFVGVALAITAFPMLARIITERGQAGTRHGSLSLATGAIDDVVAWIMLAVVLASPRHGPARRCVTGGGAVLFGLVLCVPGRRPTGAADGQRPARRPRATAAGDPPRCCSWPPGTPTGSASTRSSAPSPGRGHPRSPRTDRMVEHRSPRSPRSLLLPLFFTYSGLNTEFGLLADPARAAVRGRPASRWRSPASSARAGWRPGCAASRNGVALRVGALMNARGLMQLIALNVGLEAGIVTPALFTVLVLVALVTTLMTTPLLSWIERREARDEPGDRRRRAGEFRFSK